MNLEEAKKLIKSLLEGVGVSVVYYVDDYQSFDGLADFSKYIEDSSLEELQQHKDKLPEAILVSKEAGVELNESIQMWWDTLSNEIRDSILKELVPSKDLHAENALSKAIDKRFYHK